MEKNFKKMVSGYQKFRKKYALDDQSVMQHLSDHGQQPKIMVVACCDSRVDPALILQCEPGDLFVVRNVANIVPPYEKDDAQHGTSAALEFGVRFLQVEHLVILGHSQCGGMKALMNANGNINDDFITKWVSLIKIQDCNSRNIDECAKLALLQSYNNCMTFPWIKEKVVSKGLLIHLWFFDIKSGCILTYSETEKTYIALD
jgi:carbonic anhydrase